MWGLLRLFVNRVLALPLAVLLELETVFERLLVLLREVVHTVAAGALEFDEIILRHGIN